MFDGQTYVKNRKIRARGRGSAAVMVSAAARFVGRRDPPEPSMPILLPLCLIFAPMVYKVIGLMSGSSLDGLDIAYVHLQERAGKWEYEFVQTQCQPYPDAWKDRLRDAPGLSALDYQLLHTDYGHWLGEQVLHFITGHGLAYQVQLIASHGHTAFHLPARRMTAQLGDGAALAATTGINTVSDLRAMDIALGGQGAPIVPGGERLLFAGYDLFLNLGGIANISGRAGGAFVAWDVCPAGRVLDLLAAREGLPCDEGGSLAASGRVDDDLLRRLNALPYYGQAYPKSLANDFGTDTVFPMIAEAMGADAMGATEKPGSSGVAAAGLSTADALRTFAEHIAVQVSQAVSLLKPSAPARMLLTGGGAHNRFLAGRLRELLQTSGVDIIVPEKQLIDYKEALVMALLGVLRWREENNVPASVTGARRDSIGGAVWIGQEA
jgi:anhydro-N-acetylmuramic acid kinase